MELIGKVHKRDGLPACPHVELREQVHVGEPLLESEKLGLVPAMTGQPFPDRLHAKPEHRGSVAVEFVVGLLLEGISQAQGKQDVLQGLLVLTLVQLGHGAKRQHMRRGIENVEIRVVRRASQREKALLVVQGVAHFGALVSGTQYGQGRIIATQCQQHIRSGRLRLRGHGKGQPA